MAEESVSESDARGRERGSEREGELVSIANKLIKCLQSLGWPLSTSASALATDSCARTVSYLTHTHAALSLSVPLFARANALILAEDLLLSACFKSMKY